MGGFLIFFFLKTNWHAISVSKVTTRSELFIHVGKFISRMFWEGIWKFLFHLILRDTKKLLFKHSSKFDRQNNFLTYGFIIVEHEHVINIVDCFLYYWKYISISYFPSIQDRLASFNTKASNFDVIKYINYCLRGFFFFHIPSMLGNSSKKKWESIRFCFCLVFHDFMVTFISFAPLDFIWDYGMRQVYLSRLKIIIASFI